MILRGFIAGIIATVILSAIMMMKTMMGLMPEFNVISDWTSLLATVGVSAGPAIAWILHFALGGVWGVLFALIHHKLPGGYVVSGIIFGVIAWLGMMVGFMPIAGNGFFALSISPMVPMATLILHVIFGAVLGFSYSKLVR